MNAIDAAMHRLQGRTQDPRMTVCEWARVMTSARRSTLPSVRADRLRAAAEFRQELARERSGG